MKISKIEKLKDDKYKIIIDGEPIITYDNVILSNNLLYMKNIDDKLYNKILEDNKYFDIYYNSLRFAMKSRKSKKDIIKYLDKNNVSEEDKNKIISKLEENNVINDRAYISSYIHDKTYLSNDGINKIKSDLIKLDLNKNIIEEELNKIDISVFDNKLKKLVIKKININKKYSNTQLRQRLINSFTNLGYEKDKINYFIDHNIQNDDSIYLNEFSKVYNKLKYKYDGYELKNKMILKLLSKGFKIDNIDELIKKEEE